MLCVLDREVRMCYVLALMLHVEGGPLHLVRWTVTSAGMIYGKTSS